MSARHSVEAAPISPGDGARDQLLALGVPDHDARLWAMMGPAVSATLWTYRGHALLETHRATSAHRTISATCLLHEAATTTENDTHTPRWETLIQAIINEAPNAPLIKAVSRETNSHWEAALRSRGFAPAGLVGSPLSIEEHSGHGHGHALVRAWLRWNGPGVPIPAYVRQKTEFTCGPASALMALAHARAAAPAQVSHGLVEEMELWREATYSLGVGPYGLASSLARRGLAVEVLVTHDGPVVGLTRAHTASPAVRRAIHDQHVFEARSLGVRDRIGPASLEDLRGALASGKRAIMLVDLENLNGEPTPHWVYVWGIVGDCALVHDPWNDEQFGETWVETWAEALTLEQLWESAQWEETTRARACILVTL